MINIKQKGAGHEGEYERFAKLRKKLKATQTTSTKYESSVKNDCGHSSRKLGLTLSMNDNSNHLSCQSRPGTWYVGLTDQWQNHENSWLYI